MSRFILWSMLALVINGSMNISIAQPPPLCELTIYTSRYEVEFGDRTALVVELANVTERLLVLSNQFELERQIVTPNDHAPNLEKKVDPHRGNRWRIKIVIYVPEGSPQKHLGLSTRGPVELQTADVRAGENLYLKVIVPKEALELGDCKLEALLQNGAETDVRSNVIPLRCVKPTEMKR